MKNLPLLALAGLLLFTASCGSFPATETPPPAATPVPTQPPAIETPLPPTEPAPAPTVIPAPEAVFTLTSPSFAANAEMADQYTFQMGGQCSGENYSPALAWSGVPAGTQSFALTVIDPDGGNWVHWILFNLPAETTSLPEASGGAEIGGKGQNSFGELGYGGPCPPGGTHRYVFTLYALDTALDLTEGAKIKDLQAALEGHILGQTELTGLRTR